MQIGASPLKRKIYAVHDRNLEGFLTELNMLEEVLQGKVKCSECNCTITLENIGSLSMSSEKVRICCDNLDCFYKIRREVRSVKSQ